MKEVYIQSAKRTPVGSFLGQLAEKTAPQLGACAAQAALKDAGISPDEVEEVLVGCVLQGGVGQAPARQVGIFSKLPHHVPAMTINKVCGSGLKAVTSAAERIALGKSTTILAGGIESMSQSPFYLKKARQGLRMGNQELIDGMVHDGLWDVYNQFHMGKAAELCVKEYGFSREKQDAFATESYQKALKAIEAGYFDREIEPVEVPQKKGSLKIEKDEEPFKLKLEKVPELKPAFDKEGSVTAANASSINDGAAMLVVSSEKTEKSLGRIVHWTEHAQEPEWFTTAPVACIRKLLQQTGLQVKDISSFEINEAFAAVAMAAQRELDIPKERLNPRGGAVALGHPIGASGARLLTTLLHSLRPGEKGVVSLCIGGGEAIAALVERI